MRAKIKVQPIRTWDTPSDVMMEATQVSTHVCYAKDPDNPGAYCVTHLPTGAAIFKDKSRSVAIKLAVEISKNDSQWDFKNRDGFMARRDELKRLRDAASLAVEGK